MSVSLRSAHLSLAAPAAIQAPAQLLDEADHLLQYNFEQSQADEIRKQARKSESLQRLLSLQLNNLQSLYDQWAQIVRRLSPKDSEELVNAEHEAFKRMNDDPNGLRAKISEIQVTIEKLNLLSQDLHSALETISHRSSTSSRDAERREEVDISRIFAFQNWNCLVSGANLSNGLNFGRCFDRQFMSSHI